MTQSVRRARLTLTAALIAATLPARASITVTDDTGAVVTLPAAAQRVISVAPHVTELLYAAGGGSKIVGAVSYSDYPPEAKQLPRVGDNKSLDLERIVALKPDLIVCGGTAMRNVSSTVCANCTYRCSSASRIAWTILPFR